jgi:hypothetical protein
MAGFQYPQYAMTPLEFIHFWNNLWVATRSYPRQLAYTAILVCAVVVERIFIRMAREHDRLTGHCRAVAITLIRHQTFVADVDPGLAEKLFLFDFEDLRVDVVVAVDTITFDQPCQMFL